MESSLGIASVQGYAIPALLGEPGTPVSHGTVVMLHGIFTDKRERGRFDRLSSMYQENGYRTLRFDYQGHGDHPVLFESSSISGDVSDFDCVLSYVRENFGDAVEVLASSFGASIVLLHAATRWAVRVRRMVFLNPVTDYYSTFVAPEGPDLATSFTPDMWNQLRQTGHAEPLPGFKMGVVLGVELMLAKPYLAFDNLTARTLVIHGTADRSVPFQVTRMNALRSPKVTFEAIDGADHAFAIPWEEERAFSLIRNWLGLEA